MTKAVNFIGTNQSTKLVENFTDDVINLAGIVRKLQQINLAKSNPD